jgi:hypothetical protein
VNVFLGKSGRVRKEKTVDQVVCEIGNVVTADTIADEAQLFKVHIFGDPFFVETLKEHAKVGVKSARELGPKTATLITGFREAEPVLSNLRKTVPRGDESRRQSSGVRLLVEKLEVPNDPFVEFSVPLLSTVEDEKWIDEERQVRDERNVERPIGANRLGSHLEGVRKV